MGHRVGHKVGHRVGHGPSHGPAQVLYTPVIPRTCKKVIYYENHWGTMSEIIVIHTYTLYILSFSSKRGKAKKTNFRTFLAIKMVLLSTSCHTFVLCAMEGEAGERK